jgi:hypothetical protein
VYEIFNYQDLFNKCGVFDEKPDTSDISLTTSKALGEQVLENPANEDEFSEYEHKKDSRLPEAQLQELIDEIIDTRSYESYNSY